MKRIDKRNFRILLAVMASGSVSMGLLEAQQELASTSPSPTIVNRSPFLPPGFTPPQSSGGNRPAKGAVSGYEFRGVYQIGGEYRFLVSEPRSRDGDWVKVGESSENYEVRRYDASSETLVLFFNNSENELSLADLESNPTPVPVSGQIQTPATGSPTPQQPARRTIRPSTRTPGSSSDGSQGAPPPPAWLEKLREEAATRRAQAAQTRYSGPGSPPGSTAVNPSGTPGPDYSPPPPPTSAPPTPPPNLFEIEIPPPPTELPPTPPPDVQIQMLQTMSRTPPGG